MSGRCAAVESLVVVVAAVVGLFVGSFLNVVVYRAPLGLSVSTPRSFCPTCDRQLAWWENVPVVSWLALRGRCHTCHEPISVRYPLVEATTGGGLRPGGLGLARLRPSTAGYCVLAATAIAVGPDRVRRRARRRCRSGAVGAGLGQWPRRRGARCGSGRWAVARVVAGRARSPVPSSFGVPARAGPRLPGPAVARTRPAARRRVLAGRARRRRRRAPRSSPGVAAGSSPSSPAWSSCGSPVATVAADPARPTDGRPVAPAPPVGVGSRWSPAWSSRWRCHSPSRADPPTMGRWAAPSRAIHRAPCRRPVPAPVTGPGGDIRTVIVDDHELLRAGTRGILEDAAGSPWSARPPTPRRPARWWPTPHPIW